MGSPNLDAHAYAMYGRVGNALDVTAGAASDHSRVTEGAHWMPCLCQETGHGHVL